MAKYNFEDSAIYSEIQKLIFLPVKNKFDNPYWVNTKSDNKLACYYFNKYPEANTIVHFHGNGETVKDYLQNYVPIMDILKLNIFLVEYRGYGMSTGEPDLSEMLNDIESIFETLNIPEEQIVVYGRSFGSLSAIHAVSLYPKISGLVLESGLATLPEYQPLADYFYYKPISFEDSYSERELDEIEKLFNIKAKISSFRGSTLMFHCKNDNLIPLSNAKKLIGWANEPKLLKIYEIGNHNSFIYENKNFIDYHNRLYDFVKKNVTAFK